MTMWMEPTGQIITGHVLDMSVSSFKQALTDYDSLLYVRWNPKKNEKMGKWEIRRRPERKSVKERHIWKGTCITVLDYVEIDIVNHVLDVDILDMRALGRIREMDMWATDNSKGANYGRDIEYKEAVASQRISDENYKEMLYNAKQHRKELNEFREMVRSGVNPALITTYWDVKKKGS